MKRKILSYVIILVLSICNHNLYSSEIDLVASTTKRYATDTLVIDLETDMAHLHVYHEKTSRGYQFHEVSSKPLILKSKKSDLPFTGTIKMIKENREVLICPFIKGIPDGVWIKYNEEGQKLYEVNVKEGFFHGMAKYFSADGKVRKEGIFRNGYPDGMFIEYGVSGNTGDRFKNESAVLRTKIYNTSISQLPYSSIVNKDDNREMVTGIYVSDIYVRNYLPEIFPGNDMYWTNEIKCQDYKWNPLPLSEVFMEGKYVSENQFSRFNGAPLENGDIYIIKPQEMAEWKDGQCLWHEKYDGFIEEDYPYYERVKRSDFKYYQGYYTEERVERKQMNSTYSETNIHMRNDWSEEDVYFDSLITNRSFYIKSQLLHGETALFTEEPNSIQAPEGKFWVYYNYSEGKYFLGKKTGEWKYYLVRGSTKALVCTENYLLQIPPQYVSFKVGSPFQQLCSFPGLPDPKLHGAQKFYRLNDSSLFLGYNYSNGEVVGIIKG